VIFCTFAIVEKKGYIEIRISGKKGNQDVSPDNFDIKEIITVLEQVENMLFPNDKTNRPVISYAIEDGSVRHLFKTSIQAIIGFNAILGQINSNQNIDFLDLPTAQAIETFQKTAIKKDFSFSVSTSLPDTFYLKIDKTSNFYRNSAIWADAEFYFYGKVTNAGGKDKANIHIQTDDLGRVIIETPIEFLEKQESNILYKYYGIRALGKQHSETGEIDKTTLKFVEIIDYHAKYDEIYLDNLIKRASDKWQNIKDPDTWLRDLRGGLYEA
jgi:hypothetical protein